MIQINMLQKIIGAVIITALVVAGVMYVWHASLTRAAEQKLHKYNVENAEFVKSLKSKDVIIKGLRGRIDLLEEALLESKDHLPGDLLKIYNYNGSADIEGVGFCLLVPEHYSLTEKVKIVVDGRELGSNLHNSQIFVSIMRQSIKDNAA